MFRINTSTTMSELGNITRHSELAPNFPYISIEQVLDVSMRLQNRGTYECRPCKGRHGISTGYYLNIIQHA